MKMLFVSLCVDENLRANNTNSLPFGIRILSQITKMLNVETEIFDLNAFIINQNLSYDILSDVVPRTILEYKADYIGFYTRFDILSRVLLYAEKIKKAYPQIKILLGGPGVHKIEELVLKSMNFIDIICSGEGEETIKELFLTGKLSEDLESVSGIYFRKNKDIIKTSKRKLIENLDALPFPYTDIPFSRIEAGRGCPYDCSFCSTSVFWERKYRVKSPVRLVNEMQYLHDSFGISEIELIHDNITVSEKYIYEFTRELLKRNLHIKYNCSSRIDNINENIVRYLKESGCVKIYFGIESGSEKIQNSIGKKIDLNIISKNLKILDKYQMPSVQSYITGFPDEDENDLNQTLKLAIHTANYLYSITVQLHYLEPTAGTAITNKNKHNLYFDPKLVIVMGTKRNASILSNEEIVLIKMYPEIFSGFYRIKETNKEINKYNICYCFSHLLVYFKKTLNILVNNYNIIPSKLFSLFTEKCDSCKNCVMESEIFTLGGNGCCANMNLFLEGLKLNFTNIEKTIFKYETDRRNTSVKALILDHHKTENITKIEQQFVTVVK